MEVSTKEDKRCAEILNTYKARSKEDKLLCSFYQGSRHWATHLKETHDFWIEQSRRYAKVLGYTHLEVLEHAEKNRRVSFCNHYQESKFPALSDVTIIENRNALKTFFSKAGILFYCPYCKSLQPGAMQCESGIRVKSIYAERDTEICNWKVYGLFGGLGKEFRFVLRDEFLKAPEVFKTFKPYLYGQKLIFPKGELLTFASEIEVKSDPDVTPRFLAGEFRKQQEKKDHY